MSDRARVHRGLAVCAGVLATLAVAAGEPSPRGARGSAGGSVPYVGVLDVARWVRGGKAAVRLIDVRTDSQFDAYHVPGAEHVTASQLGGRRWSSSDTLVIYADEEVRAVDAAELVRRQGAGRAAVLRGGVAAWIDSVVAPRLPSLPPTASAGEQAARREHLELSRYFGGLPAVLPVDARVVAPSAAPLPSRGSPTAAAVARIKRRGC